ncbi:RCC1 domain-containing protein [Intrasporangium sp.]|uniref:RCC1-like domain-containing protein n=1 Tax=Intrasporangium sp. TaxID=1925024 RepID=UPI0034644580
MARCRGGGGRQLPHRRPHLGRSGHGCRQQPRRPVRRERLERHHRRRRRLQTRHTVGLRSDGTAVAVGRNDDGQCETAAWSDLRVP